MAAPNITPTRQELAAILSARTGDLAETPYAVLLLALAVSEKSAVLTLRRNQLQKEIVFEAGAPVDCRSNIVTETLGRFLVTAGKISEEDRHLAFAESTSRGVPLGEILVERKLLTPSELFRVLQQSLGRKLLEPFSWKTGTWEISLEAPPVESPLRVKVPQLVVTGVMKVEAQDVADEAAGGAAGKFVAISEEPLFGDDDFRASKDQQAFLDLARKGKAFDYVRSSSGIEAEDLSRILCSFLLLGLVEVTDEPVIRRPRPEPQVETGAVAPTAEIPFLVDVATVTPTTAPEPEPEVPAAPTAVAATAEEVMAAYLGHKRKDAFDLLGVSEDAGLLHIKEAFVGMADRFLPTKFDEGARDGIRDKAQEVFLAAARAYAVLADDARREALVRYRQRKREEAAAPKPEAKKMIDPEELCRNGRDLAVSGKFREALSYFEMASECDVQNGTYAAEAIWCRFRLGSLLASKALTELKHALRRDPQSGVTHLYLGKVMATMGQKVEAAAYIDRAARLMPGDDRPARALKALQ